MLRHIASVQPTVMHYKSTLSYNVSAVNNQDCLALTISCKDLPVFAEAEEVARLLYEALPKEVQLLGAWDVMVALASSSTHW